MFDELGPGVFRRRYQSLDLNVGAVIGEDGVLIVDTRSHREEAAELLSDLSRITDLPVRWVINTHWHWDHVFGNELFGHAEIWGHENCRNVLLERGDAMKESARRWLSPEAHEAIDAVEVVAPTKTFSDTASLDIGRSVEIAYHGLGHTDADVVVRVPDAGVAYVGDLVEEGSPPNFGDSYPVAWQATVEAMLDDLGDLVVPGHGDVVDTAFVRSQQRDLLAVAETAAGYVMEEMSLEEASAGGPYPVDVMHEALTRALEVA